MMTRHNAHLRNGLKANGFVKMFNEVLETVDFPMKIGTVIRAKDPLLAVANGALLASML